MNSAARKVELVDQIGLSSDTFRLKEAQPPAGPRPGKRNSQPTKLLILSLLIMSCLCGSVYYGSMRPDRPAPAGRTGSR
jgi:hypothetical protein